MAGAAAVLVIEQQDEVRMGREVVEGTLDQFADRGFRRQSLEIERALLGPDFLVNPFQYRKIQRVLVAEIVKDQLLVDACALGNVVDARAGQAAAGEFAPRGGQKLLLRRFRVTPPRDWAV